MNTRSELDSPCANDGADSILDSPRVWWWFAVPIGAIIITAIRAVRAGWVPRNDRVFVQLRVLDVFSRNTPLAGMPSTLSGSTDGTAHHPGPGQFWLLAVPFRAVSSLTDSSASLAIAAAIVTVAALVVVVWCLKNLGCSTTEGLMACGFISVAIWQATTQVAVSPWNPDFAFIMFVAATALCIANSVRGPTLVATSAVVVFASLAAQAHLSFAIPSVALVAVTFAYSFRCARGDLRRWILVIAAVSVAVWSGPILDLVRNAGGNIATLASAGDAAGAGFVAAFDRFAHSMAPWQHGLRRPRDGEVFLFTATWTDRLFGLVVIAAVAAVSTMHGRAGRLAVTALSLIVATIVAAAISPMNLGTAYAAHVQRVWIVPTLLAWATLMVGLLRVVRSRFDSAPLRRDGPLGVLGMIAAVVLVTSAVWSGFEDGTMYLRCSDAVTSLASSLDETAQDGDIFDSTAITFVGLGPAQDIATGLYGELILHGTALLLAAETDPGMISEHYLAPRTRPRTRSIITVSPVPPTSPTTAPVATATCQTPTEFAQVWVWRHSPG